MKAQGIDYGGYTAWKRSAIKPGVQVDFAICGIGWGIRENPHWAHNKPEIIKEERRLIYQFYNHAPAWEDQADFTLREYEAVDAHAVFTDWERSTYGVRTDKDMPRQSNDLYKILNKVKANVDGRVGVYGNFNDYYLAQQHVDLSEFPFWVASPDEWAGNEPGSDIWWYRTQRPKYDYVFDQWSHKGYAPDYGAVNNKKSMDLTQCKHDLEWLDAWLGIKDSPTPPAPPPADCTGVRNQTIDEAIVKLEDMKK